MYRITAFLLATTLLAGCDLGGDNDPPTGPDPVVALQWYGELAEADKIPQWSHIQAEALLTWLEGSSNLISEVLLQADTPGVVRAWSAHHGTCSAAGAMLGAQNNYPPLEIDNNGRGYSGTVVGATPQETDLYHVIIYLSTDETDTVIACIDLDLYKA